MGLYAFHLVQGQIVTCVCGGGDVQYKLLRTWINTLVRDMQIFTLASRVVSVKSICVIK